MTTHTIIPEEYVKAMKDHHRGCPGYSDCRRYRLSVVYPDGNPVTIEDFADLEEALSHRDHEAAALSPEFRRRLTTHYFVHDLEDPERGELSWEDAE